MTNKQLKNLKDTLWMTADQLRANSGLKSTEYAEPKVTTTFTTPLDTQLFLLAKGTPMAGMGYHEIFRCLPKEKQEELMNRKAGFAKTAGIE